MQGLRQQALRGIRWTTVNAVGTALITFLELTILGRLLGPEPFGLMAMVMVVSEYSNIFANFGLSDAIIQRKNNTREALTTLYWVNVAIGFILFVIVVLFTPLIAKGFGVRALNYLLPVTSFAFVISSFGVQFQTLLRKILRFDILAKANVTSVLLGFFVSVASAWYGYGVWAMVAGYLTRIFFRTIFFMIWGFSSTFRPFLYFRWDDDIKNYLGFGLYRMGAMIANEFSARVDQLLIGVLMGPLALGYYNFAFRLVLQPVQMLNPILTQIAFPVFSIVQDNTDRLQRGFLKMVHLLMSVNSPILIGLAAISPVAIPLLFGEKWGPAIPLIQVLAFYSLIRSLGNAGASIVIAKGKANWALYWNIVLALIIPVVIYSASLGGNTIHIALALVGVQFILFFCFYQVFIRVLLGPCFLEYIKAVVTSIVLAVVMGIIVTLFSYMLEITPIATLLSQIFIGSIVYIILCYLLQRTVCTEFINLFAKWCQPRQFSS